MRRPSLPLVLSSLALSLPLASLSCSNAAPGGDGSGAIASPIVNGNLDLGAHPAVVYVQALMGFSSYSCTGTIFQTDVPNNVGYVITAAHCVRGDMGSPDPTPGEMSIITGDNGNNQSASTYHQVLAMAYQPGANPPAYDVAIIKFQGVTASTPTLPLTTPELDADLAAGQEMQIVGFGESGPNFDDQKKRNEITNLGPVTQYDAVDDLTIAAPVGPMGNDICEGDSGGPWLRTINGQQYVVAVTSVGIGDANGTCGAADAVGGVGARVAPFLKSLIGNFIAGIPVAPTCDECTTAADGAACKAQADTCSGVIDCYEKATRCMCGELDDACFQTCITDHPGGATEYMALLECECGSTVCGSECTPGICTGIGGAGGAGGSAGTGGSGGAGGDAAGGAGGDAAGGSGGMGEAGAAGEGGEGGAGNGGASAGGSSAAGASGASTAGGTTGSAGTASGQGGAAAGTTGAAGTTTGSAGTTTGSAGTTTGSAGTTSKGGSTSASAGSSGAAGTTSAPNDTATSPSDSSGGCEVSAPTRTPGAWGIGLLLGLLAIARGRRDETDRG